MRAIEQGIVTSTTKGRLEELEKEKNEIEEHILIEKAKMEEPISKKEIIKYVQAGLSKEPKLMVRQLINKVVIFDDKVEIYFKYTKKPDDDSQASSIYNGNITITSSSHKYTSNKKQLQNDVVNDYATECFI